LRHRSAPSIDSNVTSATTHPSPIGSFASARDDSKSIVSGYEACGTRSRLRVQSCPLDQTVFGQAFWDTDEEVIAYHMIPHRPYDSYVHGDTFRIDTDTAGQPVFFELQWHNRNHLIVNGLQPPSAEIGGVRLLDLRIRYHELSVMSTNCHSTTYVEFDRTPVVRHLLLGSGMILCLSQDSCLCGLWIVKTIPDPGGRLQSQWRSRTWRTVRRQRLESAAWSRGGLISPISSPKVC
jgi:hypothetical protein